MGEEDMVEVSQLEPGAARDGTLVDDLTRLVNDVFEVAESGLWREGTTRTTSAELAALIAAHEVVVARRDGQIVGSVQVHDVCADVSEFGMLVADPGQRGTGIGRTLVDFVERSGRERGLRAIRLELLLPRAWRHPTKEFLKSWYGRRGYRVVRTGSLVETHPHLVPLLATPCDLVFYEKPLSEAGSSEKCAGPGRALGREVGS